ncbi:Uncharacterised protein [Streptococcus pneumoniae]|nr:Uncharacterised protein [Streptococcus pneumoniae]CEX88851.1 Uncharacterised protein [Streptococcus pneumoniae]CJC37142.1 Uncharacterised protein [Streptococcus pneumoniae]CJG78441.1 Uncharacterised protein [Streptococcus pneumoniae]CJH39010.1 Uncharacterised protein [Streptococcus pneumoniae]
MFAAIALRTPVTGISISPGIVGTETGFAASTFCATGAAFGASGRASTTAATASSFFAAPACGIFPDSTSFKISLRVIRPFAPVPSTRSKSTLCSPASFNTAGEKRGFPSVGCFTFGAFSDVATSAFGSSFVFSSTAVAATSSAPST